MRIGSSVVWIAVGAALMTASCGGSGDQTAEASPPPGAGGAGGAAGSGQNGGGSSGSSATGGTAGAGGSSGSSATGGTAGAGGSSGSSATGGTAGAGGSSGSNAGGSGGSAGDGSSGSAGAPAVCPTPTPSISSSAMLGGAVAASLMPDGSGDVFAFVRAYPGNDTVLPACVPIVDSPQPGSGAWLARFHADGSCAWSRYLGPTSLDGSAEARVTTAVLGADGAAYVSAGAQSPHAVLSGCAAGAGMSPDQAGGNFVAKILGDGTCAWATYTSSFSGARSWLARSQSTVTIWGDGAPTVLSLDGAASPVPSDGASLLADLAFSRSVLEQPVTGAGDGYWLAHSTGTTGDPEMHAATGISLVHYDSMWSHAATLDLKFSTSLTASQKEWPFDVVLSPLPDGSALVEARVAAGISALSLPAPPAGQTNLFAAHVGTDASVLASSPLAMWPADEASLGSGSPLLAPIAADDGSFWFVAGGARSLGTSGDLSLETAVLTYDASKTWQATKYPDFLATSMALRGGVPFCGGLSGTTLSKSQSAIAELSSCGFVVTGKPSTGSWSVSMYDLPNQLGNVFMLRALGTMNSSGCAASSVAIGGETFVGAASDCGSVYLGFFPAP